MSGGGKMLTDATARFDRIIKDRMIFMKRYSRVVAVAILVVVFGYSGLHKIIDPAGFSLSVFRYHLLPYAAVNAVSLWIAWLELACAFILLFIPRIRVAALWLIFGLLLMFSFGIGINLVRGSHMACGCFSSSPMAHPGGWLALVKTLGLLAVATCFLMTRSMEMPSKKLME